MSAEKQAHERLVPPALDAVGLPTRSPVRTLKTSMLQIAIEASTARSAFISLRKALAGHDEKTRSRTRAPRARPSW